MSGYDYIDELKVWGRGSIEDATVDQAKQTTTLPFVPWPVALMPDAHVGLGSTVGSVIPTQGAIIPSAIGVDIGCGMVVSRLDLTSYDLPDDLGELHARFVSAIPAGVGKSHEHEAAGMEWLAADEHKPPALVASGKLTTKAQRQFGTLGSGNHFLEVCLDEADRVWVVLHSGSRGPGNELARRHIETAKGLMKAYFIDLEDPDLAYLVEGTPEFDAYIADMLWAQRYAAANRDRMMALALDEIVRFLDRDYPIEVERINCHHNFTEREHHNGQNVWLTRKGAIRAREGDRGVIPGSMGTASYIVTGLGSEDSYQSCSHGAGRVLSRKKARERFTEADLIVAMKGRTWNEAQARSLVDEIPGAYKDIDAVMAAQRDLVRVDHELHQILNMKGA